MGKRSKSEGVQRRYMTLETLSLLSHNAHIISLDKLTI